MSTLGELVNLLEAAYPPALAESWDAIGLVCGDPADPVDKALICVDPTESTVDEAIEVNAKLIVAHHPLLLRGVHGVPTTTPKGALVHRLIRAGIGLYCAHTNADAASPGVSDALAAAIGLTGLRPLDVNPDGVTGIGRIGTLPSAQPLGEFVARVAAALPATATGVRADGAADRPIRTVAVCGGAGDSYLELVRSVGVDAYVTADLRHHPAGEHGAHPDAPALVDVAHWASEWPWCAQAADVLRAGTGGTVDIFVSTRRTDAWTIRVGGGQLSDQADRRPPA